MLKKIILAALAAGLVVILPASVNAYGAAHVGYTHVGPNGAYHTGTTVASGPSGTYGASHTTTAYGGGAYHAGYTTTGGVTHGSVSTTGTSSGYYYAPKFGAPAANNCWR